MLVGRSQLNENIQGDFSILQQISALRKENRFLKVGLVFCLVLSALPYLTGFQPETIRASKVVTERIEFVRDGETTMSIATHPQMVGLVIRDKDDSPVIIFGGEKGGRVITLVSERLKPCVGIGSMPNGGVITVHNRDGNPVAALGAGEDGGLVGVFNKDGKTVTSLGADEDGGLVKVCSKDGKTAVLADVVEGHGRVAIWNGKPKAVAMMAALSFGGGIALADENGKIIWTAP